MIAKMDNKADYLNALFEGERGLGLAIKWVLWLAGVLSTGLLDKYRSFSWLTIGVLSYTVLNLLFTTRFILASATDAMRPDRQIAPGGARRLRRGFYFISYAADILFASQVIYYSGGASSEMYFLYALLALKSAIYYPAWHAVSYFSFMLGPLYVLVLYLSVGSLYFLLEPFFFMRYVLLLAVVLTALYLGWLNERAHLRELSLRHTLAERTVDLDRNTRTIQQMATNLGNRVLELRTLQEGIKAINSALALQDVLRLIVANASQVLEGARCSVALFDKERKEVVSMAASDSQERLLHQQPGERQTGDRFEFDKNVATWVTQQGRPVLSSDVRQDGQIPSRFRASANGLTICSVISVPLFLGNEAIGALIAASPERDAFDAEDLNLLNAFADQAAVAVKNARLYEQLAQEQRQTAQLYQHVQERRNELEAILRGIGDGVIVTDPQLNLLLMNPVATRIFRIKSPMPALPRTSGQTTSPLAGRNAGGQWSLHPRLTGSRGPPGALFVASMDGTTVEGDSSGRGEVSTRQPDAGTGQADATSSVPLVQIISHPELISLFQDALRGGEKPIVREITLSFTGDKASTIYQALASSVLSADGKVRGVVTVLRDVTSQKELERMKSNFLSVVSHELKTPLHSIKGFVDIILMGKTGPVNATQVDFLSTVRDQTTHLQNLINDLLEFSRLESGQVKLRLTEVSLTEIATAVVAKFKPLAEQGQVQLVNRIGPDIPTLEADRMRIEQVLSNLVDNALKFTPASGIVTVSATDLDAEIQVAVSDTGIGIPSTELTRIFDRFYQVDSGSTRPYRGTGLGLTICKHIIEYHRGRIWVESEEGKGSTFFFVLPKRLQAEDDQLLLDFLSLPKDQG